MSFYSFKQGKFLSKFSGGQEFSDARFLYDTDKKALVATGSQVKVFDLNSDEAKMLLNVNLDSQVTCVQSHPLSPFILAGTQSGSWNFIDIETSKIVEKVQTPQAITSLAIHTFG